MKKLKEMGRALVKSISFSFKYAPLKYSVNIIVEIVYTILPFLILYNWQYIIETMSKHGFVKSIWLNVAFYVLITLLNKMLGTLKDYADKQSSETIYKVVNTQVIQKVNSLDVGKYYDPAFSDSMSVVDNSPCYADIMSDFIVFVKTFIIMVISLVSIGKVYFVPSLIILLLYIPSVVISSYNVVKEASLYLVQAVDNRKSSYYRSVLTERECSMELRLYGYEDLFKNKYNKVWKKMFTEQIDLFKKQQYIKFIANIASVLGVVVLMVVIAKDIIAARITPGQVYLYIGLVLTLMGSIDDFSCHFSYFCDHYVQCTGRLESFMSLSSALDESGRKILKGIPEITFKNVSFRYPGTERFVLKNINFTLKKGEKLSLVGINGAGKTTLTKLLLRLYDPTQGEIFFDGVNAKEYDINSLRACFGVLFQDTVIYSNLSLKDNITVADMNQFDEKRFMEAVRISGVDKLALSLKKGYDNMISRKFDPEGVELSGGQRQEVGIARAYYRNAGIIILDEPSSALDAKAEDNIFNQFVTLCRDKSAVLISHRLSSTSITDKIAVLEDGVMLEFGTHDQLMKNNSRYSYLYNLQANKYIGA